MEIKFHKNYKEYKYICSFDIATHCGCSVYSILENKILYFEEMYLGENDSVDYFYKLLFNFFEKLEKEFDIQKRELFVLKERYLLQMMGGRTNIKTIVNLIKWQTIFDLFMQKEGYDVYDNLGIAVATCKSFYRKVLNQKDISKLDIQGYVCDYFNIHIDENMTDNISDSMSLILPFFVKWNKDIDDRIKEIKKEIKQLKQKKVIEIRLDEIKELEKLKQEN